MLPSRRHRFHALLLALVLLGGGIVLPVADALIFHALSGSRATPESLLTSTGSNQGHQQLCLQIKATGQMRSVPGQGTSIAQLPASQPSRMIAHSPAPATSPAPSNRFSRAPPDLPITG
jgi:hypothetical protein